MLSPLVSAQASAFSTIGNAPTHTHSRRGNGRCQRGRKVLPLPGILLALAIGAFNAGAANFTWSGGTSGDWGTAANWDATPTFAAGNNFIFYALPQGNLNTFLGGSTARTIGGLTFNSNVDNDIIIRTYSNDTGTGGEARNLNFTNGTHNVFITVASGATGNITIAPGGGRPRIASNLVIDHNGSGNLEIGNFIQKIGTGTRNVTKTGTGTLTLSNANRPTTQYDDLIINAGKVRLAGNNATGAGSIIMTGGTLSTIGTGDISLDNSYNFSGSLTFGNAADSGRITFSNSSATGTLAGNTTLHTVADLTLNQAIGETGGNYSLTKTGANTLTLSGNNTFAGAVNVQAGLLELSSSGGAAAGSATSVAVATNAVLLLSQSDQVNNSAAVSLSGGTIRRGNGVSEAFGNLSLATDSFLDFGTGPTGTLSFGSYTPGALLKVNNFLPGNTLTFGSDLTTMINDDGLFSFDSAFISSWNSGTGTFTVTAVARVMTAMADGNWGDASTWDQAVPAVGDEVVIPEGITVTINGDFTCGKIKVHGKLEVARADTSLTCDSIMVMGPGSLFEIGTPNERFTHKFTLTLKGLASAGMGMMGTKFIGAHNGGRLEFHGEERVSWTRLGANAAAGASSITMLEPVDWRPGEEILITSTSTDWNQAEKRVVASVTPDGLTVHLTSPLNYFHSGETRTHTRPTDGKTWSIDLRAEVGLLSRNVLIQGDAESEVSGFGGHIMVMNMEGCCETPGVGNIQGVELYRMGQKGMLGRYPFHWHMLLNTGQGQYFRNNSVHRSFNRAITIHGTESTLVEDNFCYDHIGHGLFLEDGSERFNTIRRNVVVLSKRPARGEEVTPSDNERNEVQNRTPASYWITNPNNVFEDNVAAGTEGTGFWFAFPTSPMGDSAVEPYFSGLEPHKEPLGKFDRNTAHSCMNGFDINDQLNPDHSLRLNGAWENDGPFFLNDCVWYSNNVGVYAGIGQRRQNVVYYNNTFADNETAVFLATYQLVEESLLIADSGLGHFTGQPTMYAVYDGAGRMKNNHMVGWQHPDSRLLSNIGAAIKHPNHRFEGFTWDQPGPPTNILPNYDIVPPPNTGANHAAHPRMWAQVVLDIDGSITGTPNSSIIANNRFMMTGQERRPANWANNLVSPHRFAQLRASYSISSDTNPNVSVVREKARTPSAGVYYINGFKENHQLPLIVNEGFLYTYYYESLPSSNRINFTFDDTEIGDTVTVRIKEFGRHSNLTVQRMDRHNSLSSLMSAAESGYYAEPNGDLYLRPVAAQKYDNGDYVVTWSGAISLPVWDSDGDGISDAAEAAAGTNPFDFPSVLAESYEEWADRFGLVGADRDKNADLDADGFSNYQEYIIGTDPTDAASRFVTYAEMITEGMALTFDTIEGRNYRVMRSVDLVGWEPLGSAIPGDGTTVEMIDTDPPEARAFYRVLISLP